MQRLPSSTVEGTQHLLGGRCLRWSKLETATRTHYIHSAHHTQPYLYTQQTTHQHKERCRCCRQSHTSVSSGSPPSLPARACGQPWTRNEASPWRFNLPTTGNPLEDDFLSSCLRCNLPAQLRLISLGRTRVYGRRWSLCVPAADRDDDAGGYRVGMQP